MDIVVFAGAELPVALRALAGVCVQFHLGVKVTPVADGEVGFLDIPRVLTAVARGAACRDLSEGWSLWDDAARPLAELRAVYGVSAA